MTNQEFDLHHIWHPYTPPSHQVPELAAATAQLGKMSHVMFGGP